MEARFDLAAPGVVRAMAGIGQYLQGCGLEQSLLNLVLASRLADQRLRFLH